MPQFDKFSFFNQVFWFLVMFVSIYFFLTFFFLPFISTNLKIRIKKFNNNQLINFGTIFFTTNQLLNKLKIWKAYSFIIINISYNEIFKFFQYFINQKIKKVILMIYNFIILKTNLYII